MNFDDNQLDKIIDDFKPRGRRNVLDNVVKLFQILSIVGASMWIIFQYFSHE